MWFWIGTSMAFAQDPEPADDAPAEVAEAEAADEQAVSDAGPVDESTPDSDDETAPDDEATDDPDDQSAEPEDEDFDAEIMVFGRLAIDRATDDVVRRMEDFGYRTKRKGDKIVFRPPHGWMGAAVFENGQLSFRRAVVGFAGPDDSVNMELFRRMDPTQDPVEGYGLRFWLLPSMNKVETVRAEVLEALQPELSRHRAVVSRTAVQERLAGLPERLDAVWQDGKPLAGTEALATPEERRRHILEYWASRASTPEGRLTARAVADWLGSVVQESDAPITSAERSEFERRRGDGLTLPR